MHTSHNEALASTLASYKLKAFLAPTLEKIIGRFPESLSSMNKLEYVVFPAALPHSIYVKMPVRGVEVVPVVLIDGGQSVLFGRASLFR
jgi:hypothetical protein